MMEEEQGQGQQTLADSVGWSGLGRPLGRDVQTSRDAMDRSGLTWHIGMMEVRASQPGVDYTVEFPAHRALIRVDTQSPIAIVGENYRVIQPQEGFSMLDSLVDGQDMRYELAFESDGGRRICILAQIPGTHGWDGDEIVPGDISRRYIAWMNESSGRASMAAFGTSIRLNCWNLRNIAIAANKKSGIPVIRVRHTGDIGDKIDEARKALLAITQKFNDQLILSRKLADINFTIGDYKKYLGKVIVLKPDATPAQKRGVERIRSEVALRYIHGENNNLPGISGTAWSALNAVTEWADHGRRFKSVDRKFHDAMFGRSAQIKARAWDEAIEILN